MKKTIHKAHKNDTAKCGTFNPAKLSPGWAYVNCKRCLKLKEVVLYEGEKQ